MTTKEEDRTIIQLDSNSASWSDDDDSSRVSSDEEDRFQDEDDGSWKSITPTHDEDAEEFGFLQSPTNNNNVEPPLKRRMESMGIMLGDFGGDTDSNKEHWCSRYWYVWLCVSVLLVTLFLAYDAAKQYQKQADLLRGTANGLDDFDISQCNVFDGATLNIVEKVFNEVNDTSKFCQTDVSSVPLLICNLELVRCCAAEVDIILVL